MITITDFDANIYYLELNNVKAQPGLDFSIWYRLDKIQNKFSKTFESVQGLIKKITEEMPEIETLELQAKLISILGNSHKEYSIEKIPVELLNGVKGNWSILRQLIDLPIEEEVDAKEIVQE